MITCIDACDNAKIVEMTKNVQKHTTGGIPRWSPTLVLVARFSAYVWQSGRSTWLSPTQRVGTARAHPYDPDRFTLSSIPAQVQEFIPGLIYHVIFGGISSESAESKIVSHQILEAGLPCLVICNKST